MILYLLKTRPKKDGRGRTPTAFVCDEKPIQLKDLIKQNPDKQWEEIAHRKGTKWYLVRKSVMLDVHIWKPERKNNIDSIKFIISTETDGSEVKYSLCYSPEGKILLKTALYRQVQRYWIERAFQNIKSDCRSGTIGFTSISGSFMESVASQWRTVTTYLAG